MQVFLCVFVHVCFMFMCMSKIYVSCSCVNKHVYVHNYVCVYALIYVSVSKHVSVYVYAYVSV